MNTIAFPDALSDVSAGNSKVPQSEFLPSGDLAVVDQGRALIAGYTNDHRAAVRSPLPLIVFGDHTRAIKYIDFPFAMGADGVKVLQVREGLDPKFVYHYLRARQIPSAGYSRHFKFLKRLELPIPPLPDQKRIAAILDRGDTIRAKRRDTLTNLDTLAQSVFQDMFGSPSNWGERWDTGTIGSLARSVDYGSSAKAGEAGEWPILRMGNLTDSGRIDLTDLKYLNLTPSEVPKHTARRGDLLFNRTNSKEKVGKAAVVRTDTPLALAGYLVRVRFDNAATAEFVSAFLRSPYGRAVRLRVAKAAVNQANISASEMRKIPIALPPAHEIDLFAKRLAAIESARVGVSRTIAADAALFASLQSRAFRGDL